MQATESISGRLKKLLSVKAKSLLKKLTFLAVAGVVVEILALYVVMSPPLWASIGLIDRLIFHPDKQHYDVSKIKSQIETFCHTNIEDVTFSSANGKKLHAYFMKFPGAKKVIVYSHGNGGNIDYRIPCAFSLMSTRCSVFLYDYEGYGSSEGTPTLSNVCDDAVGAVDYLEKHKHYKPKEVVLFGESLGTGVTCELSKRRQSGGIILLSGFSSLLEAGRDKLWWLRFYPDWMFPAPQMDNLATLSKPHPPLLITHGTKDLILSPAYSEELMRGACPPKIFVSVPDVGHGSEIYDAKFLKAARQLVDSID